MPSKIWNAVRVVMLLGAGVGCAALRAAAQAPSPRALPPAAYRPGKIIVIPKAGREIELRRLHQTRGARQRRAFPAFRGMQIIELPPGADTLDALDAYQRSGLVEVAEPDILFSPAVLPNDPSVLSGEQWALNNTGQSGGVLDADIDAPETWDRLNSASNIIVAVIDSGTRYTHQDLAANMWVNPGEIPGNGVDDDANGFVDDVHGINAVTDSGQPLDDIGHGTHVSGVIGAVGNNGIGISGVAWRVQIMAVRFLSPGQLGTLTDLLQCMSYAQAKGARVFNCSFTTAAFSATMSNAFWSAREAGIVVAAAAGNEGTDNDRTPIYPASLKLDNIVSVTATTRGDGFSGYNYGQSSVHLGAPGSSIWSTYRRSDSDYAYESGTSMAVPHVAGALALMIAQYPTLTPAQLISRLLATVDPVPSLASRCVSGGRLNLNRAVGWNYDLRAATFAWVPTNGMQALTLADDGVSAALALPFSFPYFGRSHAHLYVSANGLVGFDPVGLNSQFDSPLPSPTITPNDAIYPYWDDLNPAVGGQIWVGTVGAAPNRKSVVSWVNVPHSLTAGGESLFSFQVLLHETGEITFQYQNVTNGRSTLISGKSASIGIEDYLGQVAVSYAYHGSLLTNGQTLVFAPRGGSLVGPTLRMEGLTDNQIVFTLCGQPGQRCVLSAAPDPKSWNAVATNTLPASGLLEFILPVNHPTWFYRAQIAP